MAFFRKAPEPVTEPEPDQIDGRVVIHIGDHKAGSTTIQNAFATDRVHLNGLSVFYGAKLNHNNMTRLAPKSKLQVVRKYPQEVRDSVVETWTKAAREAEANVSVISGENFEGLDPAEFGTMLDTHFEGLTDDLRVIVYVRPHIARILSSYAERIKIGHLGISLDDFVTRSLVSRRSHFSKRLEAWHSVLGDRLIVRPLIRSELHNGDALEDFIKVGIGANNYHVEEVEAANESATLEDLLILRLVQDRLQDFDLHFRHAMGWQLALSMASHSRPGGGTKLQMPKTLAARIAKQCASDAKALDETYFGGKPLMQAEMEKAVEQAIETPMSLNIEDHFSATEIRNLEIMADTIAVMLGKQKGSWPNYLRGKRIADLRRAAGKPVEDEAE